MGADGAAVELEDIVSNHQISTLVVLNANNSPCQLQIKNIRHTLLHHRQTQSLQHWKSLKLQGMLAHLQSADQSVSHSVLKNKSISEEILIFAIKARLQCLPTRYNLATWYPSQFNPDCIWHTNGQENETVAHIQMDVIITKDITWPGTTV